jgi:SAM-dependent methyltransferase
MNLEQVNDWRTTLGYLPVPLKYASEERRFVMLNGAKGNFCLDIESGNVERNERRDIAWSADVDHYVRVEAARVEVLRWDRSEAIQSSVADVVNNLQAFQQYLESARAPREQSVVAHAVATYNRIRAALPEGSHGLEAFLYAMNMSLVGRDTPQTTDEFWQDREKCHESWNRISESSRARIIGDFLQPKANDKRPNIELMLRHAMGRIFQEAHNLVALSPQMSLLSEGDLISLGSTSRSSGAYFTPTPLVRTLVEQCLTPQILAKSELVVLDAACGSGEFLRECVRQLDLTGYVGRVRVVGFDVSLPAVLMARFALAAETSHQKERFTIDISQSDALIVDWPQQVDVCLMNPPYASWRSLSFVARERLTEILGDLTRIRPDLAFAFLVKATNCLSPGGMLGAVSPASLLDGESGSSLRAHLDSLLTRRVVVRLGSQSIFEQATVDASMYVACRKGEQALLQQPTLMVWADHTSGAAGRALRALRSLGNVQSNESIELDRTGFSIYTEPVQFIDSAGWAPRPLESRKLLKKLEQLPKVSDFYEINQGTITGLNSAFLLNVDDFKRIPRGERKFFRKAIISASITDGQISDGHWVFYPYGGDLPVLDFEVTLNELLPIYLREYLLPHKAALRKRAGIDADRWWDLTRKRASHERKVPKVISTYFGSAGSFAWDTSGEFVVVQGYSWTPKVADAYDERVGLATVAVLASNTAAKLIAAISNNLAGGQFNLSSRFLGKMPFVNMLDERLCELVDALALIGLSMSKGEPYSTDMRDQLVTDLFSVATLDRR